MSAPKIDSSTKEEREEFIKQTYPCIADCDMCGICKIFRGRQPEIVFMDYIEGIREYQELAADIRR